MSTRITQTGKKAIIFDDEKVAEVPSNFFEETVVILDIRECNNISNTGGYFEPVEVAVKKYDSHPGIFAITKKFDFNVREISI